MNVVKIVYGMSSERDEDIYGNVNIGSTTANNHRNKMAVVEKN